MIISMWIFIVYKLHVPAEINVSYHKCGVDRKTVVDTAAIAELEYCDAEAYKTLREKFHRGQKLSEFAKQCKEMCTRATSKHHRGKKEEWHAY
ncbi:hypothetical protein DPX16_0888 [Anabarilius grahami]|uniref:Uncharacterized protein n=1 Tax=Anabarilius grahami TaxID=495550 RepID=A0A3N0Y2T4_ANAGA|nr:hypothetical protein DPX16_0888 [Anabarilius grahami]